MNKVEIVTQLEFTDYLRFNFYYFYRKRFNAVFVAIAMLGVLALVDNYQGGDFAAFLFEGNFASIFIIYTIIILPGLLFYSSRKAFNSNLRLQEEILYIFTDTNIHTKGESFDLTMTWDKIFRITESKHTLYIWQSKQTANIIPKRYLSTLDIALIKQFAQQYPGIKVDIK